MVEINKNKGYDMYIKFHYFTFSLILFRIGMIRIMGVDGALLFAKIGKFKIFEKKNGRS